MNKTQVSVSLALRDTETCTAAAEVWEEFVVSDVRQHEDKRRVLAIVSHTGTAEGDKLDDRKEEGCLFVMKYKSLSTPDLYPYLLFPIVPEFTASLDQASNSGSNLATSGAPISSTLRLSEGYDSPPYNTEFKVTFRIPKGSITLGSNQMDTLSTVLEEARRFKNLVDPASHLVSTPTSPYFSKTTNHPTPSMSPTNETDELHENHWEWLHFYLSHKASRILPSQQPKPRDIRSIIRGSKLSISSAGLPGDEDEDIALIRDEWVQRQLVLRKNEYSKPRNVKLRIGTFNVNGKPPSQSLAPWVRASRSESDINAGRVSSNIDALSKSAHTSSETQLELEKTPSVTSTATSTVASSVDQPSVKSGQAPSTPPSSVFQDSSGDDVPDIFVLGFQELDLSTEALLYSTSTVREDTWVAAIFDALGKHADDYVKLASKQLVGILVVIIIRTEMQSLVKEVSVSAAGVGIMGIMGNKGATAIRLRLNSTVLTFVCSHLAAFDEYFDKRNSDFAELCRKLQFPITWKGARGATSLTADIWETDMLFWLGDLNYRVDLPDQEVRSLLNDQEGGREIDTLLVYDQLKTAARHKRAFTDFIEHDIKFLPTYRFSEAPLDQLGYDLKRRPAWTDRILHVATEVTHVSQISYLSHPEITLSDHQPVSADFDLRVDNHDPHKQQRVAKTIFKKLGDFEDSEEMPIVTLDDPEVNFGQVSYQHPVSRTVRVKNEGNIACAFRFISLEPGSPISKEWLQVKPLSGIILPQETETITITVNIDRRTASFLNHGNTRLEENLILHLAKGPDHLLSISGSYQPTCFANSLAWLVRSPGPVREQGSAPLLSEINTLSAPRELMFLVEWLITNAQDVDGLFVTKANESLVFMIRNHLDTQRVDSGKEISFPAEADHRAIALAFGEALIQFLGSLTEPVIPWMLHPRCANAQNREDAFEILNDIPGFARNVFVSVTAFLHFISQSGGAERSAALARAFADVLLRDNPRAPPGIPALTPLGKRNFLLLTIA